MRGRGYLAGGTALRDGRGFQRSGPARAAVRVFALSVGVFIAGGPAFSQPCAARSGQGAPADPQAGPARRTAALGAVLGAAAAIGAGPPPAHAFQNRLDRLRNEPKSPGKKPDFIGAVPRTEGGPPDLAGCGDTPNCFSSAAEPKSPYYLEPWRFSVGGPAKAFEDLQAAVNSYKPGQRGIDGGGFKVQEADPKLGYLYVQFESQKKGYKDDVEFLVRAAPSGEGGEVRVRSASRQGKKDLGVNAKRLNGIVESLAKVDGWSVPLLTNERFPEYVRLNSDTDYGASGPKMMSKDASLFDMVKDFV